jgi:hypothetical protein
MMLHEEDILGKQAAFLHGKLIKVLVKYLDNTYLDPITATEVAATVLLTLQMDVLSNAFDNFFEEKIDKDEFKNYIISHVTATAHDYFSMKNDSEPAGIQNVIPFRKKD